MKSAPRTPQPAAVIPTDAVTRPPRSRIRRRWLVPSVIAALLAAYVVVALTAVNHKGLSFDEGEQIAIGYDNWINHDFRMEPANGDLVKRWSTLPLLVSHPIFQGKGDVWWRSGAPYAVAFKFFFKSSNDPAALLRQCRAMIAILGVCTGLLVFFCSRELFGTAGGLVSLAVFVSSPNMLAFGAIVSTEMTTCLTLLGCVWTGWRVFQRVTWGRLLASLAFTGLLVLSKPSAVVMFPVTAILIAVKLAFGPPIVWGIGRQRRVRRRSRQALLLTGLVAVHIAAGWASIWAAYDFRYVASPNPADAGILARPNHLDPVDANAMALLRWCHRTHFLPQGYLFGIEWLLGHNESGLAFMNGQWKYGGWPTFFPYAMWAKTPPALLALLGLSAGGWVMLRRQSRQRQATARSTGSDHLSGRADAGEPAPGGMPAALPFGTNRFARTLYGAVPFLALIVVYFSIAVTWDMNIGFRHMLPIYPAAYVLAGAVGLWFHTRHWVRNVVIALLGWHLAGPWPVYPDFLAYFSPFVGGPAQGYKHLVDSSLDWGMDLPGLKQWLTVHNPHDQDPLYFSYFGVGNPDYYGIKSLRLPGQPDWRQGPSFPLGPGIYAISATMFQSVGTKVPGPWNKVYEQAYWRSLKVIDSFDKTLHDPQAHAALLAKYPPGAWNKEYALFDQLRFGRLCAWLRHHRPPDAMVGYSILIWRLSKEDIFAAGLGPPAELYDRPVRR